MHARRPARRRGGVHRVHDAHGAADRRDRRSRAPGRAGPGHAARRARRWTRRSSGSSARRSSAVRASRRTGSPRTRRRAERLGRCLVETHDYVLPVHAGELTMTRVGVVGLGYWGPNLARNFAAIAGCELAWCCDASEQPRARWAPSFQTARFTADLDDLLDDDDARRDRARHAGPDPRPAGRARAATPASTAWSRSRWPTRSRTPSGRSRRRRAAAGS